MISNLTTEGVVMKEPVMKLASNGTEYLQMIIGLFNVRESGAQEFTTMDCTLWSNPLLAKQVMEMNLQPRDRVLVNGKFTLKKYKTRLNLRLYIYDFSLLSRATISNKNADHTIENIDYSIVNNVEVFDTTPVEMIDRDEVTEEIEQFNSEDF